MTEDLNEEIQLRSAALQNSRSILAAREQAERELAKAKADLELKSQELAASVAMLQATLEASADAILVTDAQGKVTNSNQKYAEMWGLAPAVMDLRDHDKLSEVCSKHLHDPWDYLSRVREIYETSPPLSLDLLKLTDGRLFERVSTIQYVGAQNVGRVWSFRDMTERTRAEEEVRQQREWFHVTLRSIGDGVITTDIQGKVTFLNPIAERLTGWPLVEAAGRPLKNVFHIVREDNGEPAVNPVDRVLREGVTIALTNHTALVARNGGTASIEDSAAPILDSAGKLSGAVMVFHDVTEKRQAEKALRESEQRLRASAEELEWQVVQRTAHLNESIQSLESVCYIIAHDLRAPLRAIQGFTQIVLEDYAPLLDDKGRAITGRIMNAATRMDHLIRDLLEYARLSHVALPCCVLDLNPVVDRVIENLSGEITSKNGRISVRSLPPVWGNETILEQIFTNLLSNALKFMNEGVVPAVEIWSERTELGPRIFIKDNGIGIPVQYHTRVFEMFQRVHANEKKFSGTGMGLAIVRKGMDRIGGKVGLDTDMVNGTCFQLDFKEGQEA